MFTAPPVTDEQLRAAGYTAKARAYPMSADAVRWLAKFNGVELHQVPAAWWYAPNPAVRENLEDKAKKEGERL